MEQRVGVGWRCDGCGRVARWSPEWRSYGSVLEEDEGLLRWVACSDACMAVMPAGLTRVSIRVDPLRGLPTRARHEVEVLQASAGWRKARSAEWAGRGVET